MAKLFLIGFAIILSLSVWKVVDSGETLSNKITKNLTALQSR